MYKVIFFNIVLESIASAALGSTKPDSDKEKFSPPTSSPQKRVTYKPHKPFRSICVESAMRILSEKNGLTPNNSNSHAENKLSPADQLALELTKFFSTDPSKLDQVKKERAETPTNY